MSAPGVSVVIPAYNYAQYVGEAIESVLAQDYPLFELIVVDDGSTDGTPAVVSRFRDSRVRYIHQQNSGLSAARNTGIRNAQFPFVGFLDADDLWRPGFLTNAMEAFAKLPEEYAIVACREERIDAQGNPINKVYPHEMENCEVKVSDILLKTRFAPSSVVAKKEALEKEGGFDTTLTSSEDRDMWLRIGASRRIYATGAKLLLLRQHSGSMRRNAGRMTSNSLRMLKQAFQNKVAPRHRVLLWLRAFAFNRYEAACRFSNEHNTRRAYSYLLASFFLCPFFPHARTLNVPPLFRLRALIRFARTATSNGHP